METISKILEKVSNSFGMLTIVGVCCGTSFCALIMNFLPTEYLIKFHLKNFFSNYNFILILVFLASLFLLISSGWRYWKKKKDEKIMQTDLFKEPDALKILYSLWTNSPNAVDLNPSNQKVKLLEESNLITPANNHIVEKNLTSDHIPYILNPISEKAFKQIDENKNSILLPEYYGLFIQNFDFEKSKYTTINDSRIFKANEFTDKKLTKLINQDNSISDIITQIPIIFGNEYSNNGNQIYYYGKVTKITRKSNNSFQMWYTIIGQIPLRKIKNRQDELSISKLELYRTHFALKKANAIHILELDFKNNQN